MNFNFLQTFVTVIEFNSISKAAKALNITQPAVSKQIASLEDHFGIKLLERLGRKMVPTEAGNRLNRHAKIILNSLQQAEKEINEMISEVRGNLVIGASTIPGQYILPKIIGLFKKQYPQVKTVLEISDSGKVIEKLLEHEIHLGAIGTKVLHDKIASIKLSDDELVLITPLEHPFATRKTVKAVELAGEQMVWRESDSGTRHAVEEKLTAKGLNVNNLIITAEFGSTESIIGAVEAGMGISFVSHWAVPENEYRRNIAVLRLEDIVLDRNLYIIYPKRKYFNRTAETFINFLHQLDNKGF
ncbi:transcriptional regulator, LysR family [Desulfofarcimen acetoxidans DSM 771]|uniref:Transcriptional regulator, LysR family n=1 Tax=Desulfofarcimen acetoxidans (strain ATCC 49208 / DSM 771 / KCTC 5769 / VKM B-1644 / 5575) TaxID=485916 RepID=C8VWS6_DESAS|nr:selenium metabolism-associated LysR family transcriptional regulator [Desulfofarcimen acetoxidans]ACV64440.1 transcriptional regulator, LysR family [Desulfofarcimen acetoxidans DSM 771]